MRADPSQPICFLDSKKRRQVTDRISRKQKFFARSKIYGQARLSWLQLIQSMPSRAGRPLFFMDPALRRSWVAADPACFDAEVGGRRFGDDVVHDILRFTRTPIALGRRIVLVRSIDTIPWNVRFAAAFTHARVQEKVLVPLLQFAQKGPVCITFTSACAQAEKDLVQVAKAASERTFSSAFPEVRVLRFRKFWNEVRDCKDKKRLKQYLVTFGPSRHHARDVGLLPVLG